MEYGCLIDRGKIIRNYNLEFGLPYNCYNGCCGLEGYIVSRKGVEKLLKICSDLDRPIDWRVQSHLQGFRPILI